ncbi:type VII secretion target [Nocardia jejuensis]|uniref:type VII secretion target n=1 Tax=Nocardia jejuensis TaxID=328049 RepID=UPI000ADBE058|nr:type VII secretion target [Nocardia jejuensis]
MSPDELRAAAATVDGIADAVSKSPVYDSESILYSTVGVLRAGAATAAAVHTADPAMKQAIAVVTGRYQEISHLLRTSATQYHDTDLDSAARLDALGDLNAGVLPR